MSIKVKEERLQRAAHNWEEAAQEHKKAGNHEKAAEALENAARAWENAEKVHPIGFLNHLGKGGKVEDVRESKDELGLPDDLIART